MNMSISERNILILENLEVIKMIARNCKINNIDMEDIFQDAFEISIRVIDKYDPSKGTLVNFLWPHIKQHILHNNILAPEKLRKLSKKISVVEEILCTELKRNPSNKEIAAYLGMNINNFDKNRIKICSFERVSLDKSFSDSDGNLYDIDLGYSDLTPEEYAMAENDKDIIHSAWEELTEEEREVLSYRTTYGTTLEKPMSLRQLEGVLSVSRTTIGLKEKNAAQKLRHILEEYGFCA